MSASNSSSPAARAGVAALSSGFVVTWCSGWIGGRLGTTTANTITLMLWRFALVGIALALATWVIRRLRPSRRRLGRREIAVQALIGLLAQALYGGGNVGAVEVGVSPGIAALLAALQPLCTGALVGPVLGEAVNRRQWLGLAVGLAGVVLVVGADVTGDGAAPRWAYVLPLLGMAALVAATFVERRSRATTPLLDALCIQSFASAALFAVLAVATGHVLPPAGHLDTFAVSVGWFVGFCTLGAYGFYWLTLRRASVTHVSSLVYLTPPTTMLWAWLMFGDPVSPRDLVGLVVCTAGVALALRGSSPGRPTVRTRHSGPASGTGRRPAAEVPKNPSRTG